MSNLAVSAKVEHQIARLSRTALIWTVRPEVEMAADLLNASEAGRRLGIPTKDLLRLVHERKIRFVMVNGIAHVPDDAIEECRTETSRAEPPPDQ